ncbi:MAG: leucine-rich repeat domain-containing protein [Ureaplasma sp.]|nr:leucine-rich repeat domain-containing protein [Ureaplasma sp.]
MITLPNSLTTIGYGAFQYCESLTNVSIPNSVTKIDNYAFYGCRNITQINIPTSLKTINSCAYGYLKISSIVIPNNITIEGVKKVAQKWKHYGKMTQTLSSSTYYKENTTRYKPEKDIWIWKVYGLN